VLLLFNRIVGLSLYMLDWHKLKLYCLFFGLKTKRSIKIINQSIPILTIIAGNSVSHYRSLLGLNYRHVSIDS
jgi:hypothetical protein